MDITPQFDPTKCLSYEEMDNAHKRQLAEIAVAFVHAYCQSFRRKRPRVTRNTALPDPRLQRSRSGLLISAVEDTPVQLYTPWGAITLPYALPHHLNLTELFNRFQWYVYARPEQTPNMALPRILGITECNGWALPRPALQGLSFVHPQPGPLRWEWDRLWRAMASDAKARQDAGLARRSASS